MLNLSNEFGSISIDLTVGKITEITVNEKSILHHQVPLFNISLRNGQGEQSFINSDEMSGVTVKGNTAKYSFANGMIVTVKINATLCDWRISISGIKGYAIEWVDFPKASLKPLKKNGGDAKILLPYNEGAIIDDIEMRCGDFGHVEATYPSHGVYTVFPNMLFSQFMAYIQSEGGVYLGSHDKVRGLKQIDFYAESDGVTLQNKVFCGVNDGESYSQKFPIVFKPFKGEWQDAADIYREFFLKNKPKGLKKIVNNPLIPEWYKDSPLVIAYPVRGVHDMDEMKPNALFPYDNALPFIDEIAEQTDSRLLVLLMHWEGTAPWAPPYVWPPFGGEEIFKSFADNLHARKHLLGVYCSGFGYTLQSNLIKEYNREKEYKEQNLESGMCSAPNGKVEISAICTGQRKGYDICPASETGKKILNEAYKPLFESDVDYVQILDQNHGGGQYLCYSKEHGHPAMPGAWMTTNMQKFLGGWQKMAKGKLFGCESSSAEPFMPYLLFSDNRFELNYIIGEPVPLYSYLYHEYLRNFMGNQVCTGLYKDVDNLRYRIAYSYLCGDCMTVTLTPDGRLFHAWGYHEFDNLPNKELAFTMIKNYAKCYRESAKDYLFAGKMIKPLEYECNDEVTYRHSNGSDFVVKSVLSTAWKYGDKKAQIFANHTDKDVKIKFRGKQITVKALSAIVETL